MLALILTALVAMIALAACASDTPGSEQGEPAATATKTSFTLTEEAGLTKYETCYKPTETLRSDVVRNLKYPGEGLRAFYLVRHSYTTNRWTLAADLEGRGFEGEGPIVLFNVIGLDAGDIGIGNIQPFNDIAIEHMAMESTFAGEEDVVERLSALKKEGIDLLYNCIHEALTANPNTPAYRAGP